MSTDPPACSAYAMRSVCSSRSSRPVAACARRMVMFACDRREWFGVGGERRNCLDTCQPRQIPRRRPDPPHTTSPKRRCLLLHASSRSFTSPNRTPPHDSYCTRTASQQYQVRTSWLKCVPPSVTLPHRSSCSSSAQKDLRIFWLSLRNTMGATAQHITPNYCHPRGHATRYNSKNSTCHSRVTAHGWESLQRAP